MKHSGLARGLASFFAFVLSCHASCENLLPDVIGSAYAQGSMEHVYTEYHFCSGGLQCSVEYRSNSGDLIALKYLDYSDSEYAPKLTMENYRDKSEYTSPRRDNDDVVVDAGFDNYVRGRWDQLVSGQRVKFRFGIVGMDKPLDMKAFEVIEGCPSEQLCLDVALDSWLFGMIVDPIELVYSRDSRRLLTFKGVSNLRSATGESLNVTIRYEYADKKS